MPLYCGCSIKNRSIYMKNNIARLSGPLLETVSRSHPPIAFNRNGGRKSKVEQSLSTYIDEEHALEIKAHSINNTIRTFKRYVFANFSQGFTLLTLTFNDACDFDVTDISICKDKFNLYWKNLKRSKPLAGVDLRYLGVQEFQQNGHVHFHILCHIPLRYTEHLQSKWVHGHLHSRRSTKDPLSTRKIANYFKKGISDERLSNEKHRYMRSRNLETPIVITINNNKLSQFILANNSELIYTVDHEYGFTYSQYITDLTADDLNAFAESGNEDEMLSILDKLKSINDPHQLLTTH